DVLRLLVREGYLEKDEDGRYAVSTKGHKRIQQQALVELFQVAQKDPLGKHDSSFKGSGQVRHDDSKPYEYGDPVANLNLHETLKNALIRQGAASPLHVEHADFAAYANEYQTTCPPP